MSILHIAIYELKRHLRSKATLAMLILTPLLLIFILGSALSSLFSVSDSEVEPVHLLIIDKDKGILAEGFKQFIESEAISQLMISDYVDSSMVSSENDSSLILEQKLREREGHLALYLPHGFTDAVFSGEPTTLHILQGYDAMKNQMGEMILTSFFNEIKRVQAATYVLGPEALTAVMQQMQGMNSIDGQGMTNPTLDKEHTQSFVQRGGLSNSNKEFSAMQYYTATMMVMFLLFAGLIAAISLIQEKENHTLSRLHSMPLAGYHIISGKLLGNGLLAVIQVALILVVTAFLYNVSWHGSIREVMIICLLTILCSMGLAFLASFLFPSAKALGTIFSTVIGIMTYIAGGMGPHSEGSFFASIQHYTINYWAHDALIRLMVGETTMLLQQMMILLLIGSGCLLLATLFYRKVGYHE